MNTIRLRSGINLEISPEGVWSSPDSPAIARYLNVSLSPRVYSEAYGNFTHYMLDRARRLLEPSDDVQEANPGPYVRDESGRFATVGTVSLAPDGTGGGSGLPRKAGPKKLPRKKPAAPNSASKIVSGQTIYRVTYKEPYARPTPPPSVPRDAPIEMKRARKPLMEAYNQELAAWDAAVKAQGGLWFYDDGNPAPQHVQELSINKRDIEVFVNPDPTAHLQAHGWHRKADGSRADKPFHTYGDTHKVNRVVTKHARGDMVLQYAEDIMDRVNQDCRSDDPAIRDSAFALRLILQTGMRVGNPDSRQGHKKLMDVIDEATGKPLLDADGKKVKEEIHLRTHGATTIEAQHVQVAPENTTKLQVGDKGGETAVQIRKGQVVVVYMVQKANKVGWFPIDDDELGQELLSRKAQAASPYALIFGSTNNAQMLNYLKVIATELGIPAADKLKVKDLRTAVATSVALRTRDAVLTELFGPDGRPTTQKELDQFVDRLSIESARQLKNQPSMCRKSYINWIRVLDGFLFDGAELPVMESRN